MDVDQTESACTDTEADIMPESLPLSSYAWFHGTVTREQTEELLASHAFLGEHLFLVRESLSFSGDYSISFLYAFSLRFIRITLIVHVDPLVYLIHTDTCIRVRVRVL